MSEAADKQRSTGLRRGSRVHARRAPEPSCAPPENWCWRHGVAVLVIAGPGETPSPSLQCCGETFLACVRCAARRWGTCLARRWRRPLVCALCVYMCVSWQRMQ